MFNSSVSFEGTNTISQRIPPFVNALGFDADRIRADGLLGNAATSATLTARTTLDQYLIQVVTLTTDLRRRPSRVSAARVRVVPATARACAAGAGPRAHAAC